MERRDSGNRKGGIAPRDPQRGVCCLGHSSPVSYPPSESHTSHQGHERVRGAHCTASLEPCVVSRCLHFHPPPSISFTSPLKSALTGSSSGEKYVGSDFQVSASWFLVALKLEPFLLEGNIVNFCSFMVYSSVMIYVEFIICVRNMEKINDSLRQNVNIFSLWGNSDHHVFLLGAYSGRVALNL